MNWKAWRSKITAISGNLLHIRVYSHKLKLPHPQNELNFLSNSQHTPLYIDTFYIYLLIIEFLKLIPMAATKVKFFTNTGCIDSRKGNNMNIHFSITHNTKETFIIHSKQVLKCHSCHSLFGSAVFGEKKNRDKDRHYVRKRGTQLLPTSPNLSTTSLTSSWVMVGSVSEVLGWKHITRQQPRAGPHRKSSSPGASGGAGTSSRSAGKSLLNTKVDV